MRKIKIIFEMIDESDVRNVAFPRPGNKLEEYVNGFISSHMGSIEKIDWTQSTVGNSMICLTAIITYHDCKK